ncbi:MAG: hypothetical protein R3C14_35780 [Caldilineaceae bacterium]
MEDQTIYSSQESKISSEASVVEPLAKRNEIHESVRSSRSFGVGCFHFGIKKKPPYKFTTFEYINEVEAFLQGVPNVTNIVIDQELVENEIIELAERTHICQTTFPTFSYLNIQFEIYIPTRLQERFGSGHKHKPGSVCEKFRVSIVDEYYCPVTFVEPLDLKPGEDPCQSIIVVRKFLQEQSKKSESDFIEFQYLGPSPFHANLCIKPSQESNDVFWFFEVDILDTGDYDLIEIYYDAESFNDIEEAKDYIFEEIGQELGLFYCYHQIHNIQAYEWSKVKGIFDQIIQIQKRKDIFGSLSRYFSSSKLRDAFISIAEFESEQLFYSTQIEDSYRNTYSSERPSLVLKKYVDDTIQSRVEYPTRSLLELANLFEGRREKAVESVIVLISAILGGVVGALLTVFFT